MTTENNSMTASRRSFSYTDAGRADWIASALTYKSREDYLAWRTAWRQEYAELSRTIREAKRDRDDKNLSSDQRSGAQAHCHTLRHRAHDMMELRSASKTLAGELRQAAMTKTPAA
ncbi:hypothetical protein SAMN05428964_105402 [Thalassospira xiamenensis]|uniref:Uncharacterized protein n=1 Tax=Thalassospira xiamenensis TaxID=220697 RepID=A0A285TV51_9PROT|nr:hypothetical protein SAMN05428964_105402 [Thalassospira xiamenensis]